MPATLSQRQLSPTNNLLLKSVKHNPKTELLVEYSATNRDQ
jgi:hypothetical protein